MTDEQRVQLIAEVLEQVATHELTEAEGILAISFVMDAAIAYAGERPPLTYGEVAAAVRAKTAHIEP